MRRALLLVPIVAAACFGSGSDPSPPPGTPGLRPIYSVPSNGPVAYVITQVSVDGSRMLVLTEGSSVGPSSQHPGTITSVPFDGSPASNVADVDNSEGMLVSNGGTIFFAMSNSIGGATVDVVALGADGGAPAKLGASTTTGSSVGGIVADANAIYFAATTPGPALIAVPNPTGSQDTGNNPNGVLYRIDRATHAVVQLFPPTTGPGPTSGVVCGPLKTCLWYDSGSLYFLQSIDKGGTALARLGPTDAAPTQIAAFGQNVSMTGVAFDAASIYWSQFDPVTPCAVMRAPKSGGAPTTIATSTAIACRDLAIDGTSAYVATVDSLYSNNIGGPVRGTGIARAPLAGGTFAIAPLERDDWYGAMRLELDDRNVYAVSPNVILQIPKSSLP